MPLNQIFKPKLLTKIFDAADIIRWNDQMRFVEFTELDKQSLKMIIAFIIGKYHENDRQFSWEKIIEGGIFEFFERICVTDLSPVIYARIKETPKIYKQIKGISLSEFTNYFDSNTLRKKFKAHFSNSASNINKRILQAAHSLASKVEFDIIYKTNRDGFRIEKIRKEINESINKFNDLSGVKVVQQNKKIYRFINLCNRLRYQIRWSYLYRTPKTSVLGHMLIVAIYSYLLSLKIKKIYFKGKIINPDRLYNNFFSGLFHDIPEILTKDIKAPIKHLPGVDEFVRKIEKEEMEEEIYPLLPTNIRKEIKQYTEREFVNTVDKDGDIIYFSDKLSAYFEIYLAQKNGINNRYLNKAKVDLITQLWEMEYLGIKIRDLIKPYEYYGQ